MKALLVSLCALAITSSAHAVSTLGYDFRGDYNSTSYNDAAGLPGFNKFYLKTGRIHFKGALNDRISYELRWGFYKPAVESVSLATGVPSNASRDNLNSSVEYANVTDKMSDVFSLTLGKFNTEIGGFEGGTSSADLYLTSPYYNHSAVTTLAGKNLGINQSGSSNLLYATGVKGVFNFADQNIYLIATNNVGDSLDAGNKFNQNRGLMGAVWKGAFLEKTLTALLSYHEVSPQAAAGNPDNKHMFYSAGLKYDDSAYIGSLEYLTTDYKDGASGNKDNVWSAVAKFGMKFDNWSPRVEVYTAEEKIGVLTPTITSPAKNKFTGYGAVVEYKPTAEMFRYHIAYNSTTMKPETGSDQIRNEVVVGARLLGDFLK